MQVYGITKQQVQKEGFELASNFLNGQEARSKFPVAIDFSFVEGEYPQVIGTGKGFEIILSFYDQQVSIDLKAQINAKAPSRQNY